MVVINPLPGTTASILHQSAWCHWRMLCVGYLRPDQSDVQVGSFPGITAPQHCCPLHLSQRTFGPVEVRAGLVGFMTIRPRWRQPIPSRPFFTLTISLAKIIFSAVSFDYLCPRCQIPPASRRGIAPHQPADPWQGGLPDRGCGR
jgi:hypothetical protein